MAIPGMKEIKILIPEDLLEMLMPGPAMDHLRTARKETLLALRALIDSRIAALDKKAAKAGEARKKKINVD